MAERGPKEPRQDEHLIPRRLHPRIDVDQRIARLIGVVPRRRPGVQLHGALLGQPGKGRDAIHDGIDLGAFVRMVEGPALDKRWRVTGKVLLPEAWPAHAIRQAQDGHAAIAKVRHQCRGDRHVVANQVALGEGGQLARRVCGKQLLVEVGDPDGLAPELQHTGLLEGVESHELLFRGLQRAFVHRARRRRRLLR